MRHKLGFTNHCTMQNWTREFSCSTYAELQAEIGYYLRNFPHISVYAVKLGHKHLGKRSPQANRNPFTKSANLNCSPKWIIAGSMLKDGYKPIVLHSTDFKERHAVDF